MYIQVPQIDASSVWTADGEPEKELLIAVIMLAIKDLKDAGHRAEARAFIQSEGFVHYCYWLSLDADAIRESVL